MTITHSKFTASMGNGVLAISFADKPNARILQAMKMNGLRWQPIAKEWRGKIYAGAAELLAWIEHNV